MPAHSTTDILAPPESAQRLRGTTLIALTVFALALRWLRAQISPILSVDGTTFIRLAELWLAGRPTEALSHDFHPLYGLLIAGGGWLGFDLESTGRWIAQVSSAALVLPMSILGTRLGGRVAGIVTGLLVACDPYPLRFGADVLSDPLCTTLWMSALAIGVTGIERSHVWRCGLAGALAGLAYLVRPEGGEAAVILLVLLGARLWGADRPPRRLTLASAAALGGGLLLFALPYLGWLSVQSGEMTLSQKKGVVDLAAGVASGPTEGQSVLAHVFSTVFPTYGLLAAIGFGGWLRRRGGWWWATVLTAFLHLMLLVGLTRTHGYVSRRHITPLLALAAPWAALGLVWLQARLTWPRSPVVRFASLLALTLVPALVKNARPTRADKLVLREMGQRIERAHGPGRRLSTTRPRVAHYARAEWLPIDPDTTEPRFEAELVVLTREEHARGWDRAARWQGYHRVLELGEGDRRLSLWVRR